LPGPVAGTIQTDDPPSGGSMTRFGYGQSRDSTLQ
jgi:hypothetical protein